MRTLPLMILAAGCSDYELSNTNKADPEPVETVVSTTDVDTEPVTTPETTPVTTPETTPETTPVETIPVAEAPVYAHTATELFEIDPTTGARTLVGSFNAFGVPVEGVVDIAIDLNGRMFGGTNEAMYWVDPTNASMTKLCDTQLRPYALAFTSEGVLFAGAGYEIVEVDIATCAITTLVDDSPYETSGDLVGLPDGYLYWTVRGDDGDELVRVDPEYGYTSWVGKISVSSLYGLAYDDGQLFGFSSGGDIVTIDPGNATTKVLVEDATSWWGATTNPVVWN